MTSTLNGRIGNSSTASWANTEATGRRDAPPITNRHHTRPGHLWHMTPVTHLTNLPVRALPVCQNSRRVASTVQRGDGERLAEIQDFMISTWHCVPRVTL